MHTTIKDLNGLLDFIRLLTFASITKELSRHDDLLEFHSRDPGRGIVQKIHPDFGEEIHRWGGMTGVKMHARPKFSYYCGFAKEDMSSQADIYYCHKSRSIRLLDFPFDDHRFSPIPKEGEVIMGEVQDGTKGKVFSWWQLSSIQERRFSEIMLDHCFFSAGKLESKLSAGVNGNSNPYLYWAVLALSPRYRNVEFFVNRIASNTSNGSADSGVMGMMSWLNSFIRPLDPQFVLEVQKRLRAH